VWNDYQFAGDRQRVLADAEADSIRAVMLDSGNAEAWATRGRVLAARGQLEAALAARARAEEIDPTRFSYIWGRGWIYYVGGRNEDALKVVDALVAQAPRERSVWVILACAAHVQLGDYKLAVDECERSLASVSGGWLIYANLTVAYAMGGDAEKAAQAKAKLLASTPAFTISRYETKRAFFSPEAIARDRDHMIAGLRKAGVPE
jgi:tetratricopeptide (TPR) repeat protein